MSNRQSPDVVRVRSELGGRITRARERKGLSKTDVARALGVRIATISDWERGLWTPRGDNLRQLAEALGMTADELIDVTEGADPPFASWRVFLERHPELTDEERRFLRRLPWGDGYEPDPGHYDVMLIAYRGARR